MIKIFRLLLGLIGLVIVVSFAVSNRQNVEMTLWPLPNSLDVQLFWVFLFGLVVGAVLGGLGAWLGGMRRRREGRQMRRKADNLEGQLRVIREQQEAAEAKAYEEAKATRLAANAPLTQAGEPLKQIAS
ncbi:MAG: lipopolysaccharide assembly protein LapA domain-containing protein [Geminicoccaceae bacterium]